MSNVIKLNDIAELHLPCDGAAGLYRIFLRTYQASMTSTNPIIDATEVGDFFMCSASPYEPETYTSWGIDISREAAETLQIEGVTFTEEAKEALSHE